MEAEVCPGMFSRSVVRRAVVLFLVSVAILTLAVQLIYRSQIAERVHQVEQAALEMLALQEQAIHGELGGIAADLLFLAGQNELRQYLNTDETQSLDAVAQEYLVFAAEKGVYDQIRFLDERGMEIVRVNYHAGDPAIVPETLLQAKGDRYYFMRSSVLSKDEVYVSPFDLNVEQGEVEVPRKPMIRIGTPVFDERGQKRGIVILNYLGDTLLNTLEKAGEGATFRIFLANSEGQWLLGPEPEQEWGFMFGGEEWRTVEASFPGAWEEMRAAANGRFRTDGGLFTFTTIDPIQEAAKESAMLSPPSNPETEPYRWKLITHVPADVLAAIAGPIRRTWSLIHGFLAILTALFSWLFARHQVARIELRREIEFLAKYDCLTGACNRHYFEQLMEDEEARARRYKHPVSFLMVDVTWFKQINDTHGHKVGDEVLREVSALLKAQVRKADVVVRYGGDEFLVMFPETPGEAEAARDRILAEVDRRNRENPIFDFPVILAIGSAHWDPSSGESIENALDTADERMYEHKKAQHRQHHESG